MKWKTAESSFLCVCAFGIISQKSIPKNLNWRTSVVLKINALETYRLERYRVPFSSLLSIIDKFFSLVTFLDGVTPFMKCHFFLPKLESWPNYRGQIRKIKLKFFCYLKFYSWFFALFSAIFYSGWTAGNSPLITRNSKIFLKFPKSLRF